MKVGFSGTSSGMTDAQKHSLRGLLPLLEATELHHGDSVGADTEAADLAWELGLRVVVHPPVDQKARANNLNFHEWREPKTHFARNRHIVDTTDALVVAPWSAEKTEGGTWYTHDYAVKVRKDVYIICPDGTVTCGGATWPSSRSAAGS